MKIYLAIPYSGIEQRSFAVANAVAARLMQEGHVVYSPISHNHPIAIAHGLPTTWEYWKVFDTEFLKWCDAVFLVVMNEDGFELIKNSKGVQAELEIARTLGKEIIRVKE